MKSPLPTRSYTSDTETTPRRTHAQDINTPLTVGTRPDYSSPVVARDPAEREAHRRRKGRRRYQREVERLAEERKAEEDEKRNELFEKVLHDIKVSGVRFGDLMEYVFNPQNGKGQIHWHQFFAKDGQASTLLNWWASSAYSQSAQSEIRNWAVNFVAKVVSKEAHTVTKRKELQTMGHIINSDFVSSFSFTKIYEKLSMSLAPVSIQILNALATSPRALTRHTARRKERTKMVS
jgi:hypothetical protein